MLDEKKVREPLKQRMFCLRAAYVVSHVGTARMRRVKRRGEERSKSVR